ncbi:MAG: hypothetical protein JWO86_1261 [Myxococcaceae bacterium]|nr:hypothetical protein [Myxococcaceae bacterium]
MMRSFPLHRVGLVALVLLPLLGGACTSSAARPRDVAGDRRPRNDADASTDAGASGMVPEPPPVAVPQAVNANQPRLVARASTRALAVDATNLYYGDSEDDGVYAMPKAGGEAVRLARHAPVAGAMALDADSITWIGSPGDAVYRVSIRGGGQPTTLRDRGIFSDVATMNGDIFIVEALGAGGALLRVSGATTTRLAAFDGAPRAVMADATHAYVITPTKIVRTAYPKGELETIATGNAFGSAEMDDAYIYVVAAVDRSRVVARFPKTGGPMTVLATGVRDGPLEVAGDDILYFEGARPQLRAVPKAGGTTRVIAEDESFSSAAAIEADGPVVYIATGSRENGGIVAVDRK